MCKLLTWLCGSKPQPSPQLPFGFSDTDTIVSHNVALAEPYTVDNTSAIVQTVPDGWQLHSEAVCADGYNDGKSEHSRILPNAVGLTFLPHNEVVGINGKWGFSQVLDLQPGCYLLKVTGRNWINDPKDGHANDYIISGWVGDTLLSKQVIPYQSSFEFIYPFAADVAGVYDVKWLVEVLWANPGHNSKVDILGAGILAVDSGYCDNIG